MYGMSDTESEFIDIERSPIDTTPDEGYEDSEEIVIPSESRNDSSYLSLILNPNLRELELYIRGLEYVKQFDAKQRKEVVKMRKIQDHFLNNKGINAIIQELKIHTSSDMTLQRLSEPQFLLKTHEVGQTFHRLIFKNMKEFGMDTHEKKRHARRLWLAIKNKIDGAYSRSIGGKENDLSRAQISLTGEIGGLGEDIPYYGERNNNPRINERQRRIENIRN